MRVFKVERRAAWRWLLSVTCLAGVTAIADSPPVYSYLFVFGTAPFDETGYYPGAGPTVTADGTIYATATFGGAHSQGLLLKLTPGGAYSVLHYFGGNVRDSKGEIVSDGGVPRESVTVDSSGNVFGTTYEGGAYNHGIVFELTASGVYRDLHDFGGSIGTVQDGQFTASGVALDAHGNLFGVADEGGKYGGGIIWKLAPSGEYSIIHSFNGNDRLHDGEAPSGSVALDSQGDLFGSTVGGGPHLDGSVWEVEADGTFRILRFFGGYVDLPSGGLGPDGQWPTGVTMNPTGTLFGVTSAGGKFGRGNLWRLTPDANYTDLHDFGGTVINASGQFVPDGTEPQAVTCDGSGNLFGSCSDGGPYDNDSNISGGDAWEYTSDGRYFDLHDFGGVYKGIYDGSEPLGPVAVDSSGNIYGAVEELGPTNDGFIWKLHVPPGRTGNAGPR